MADRDAEIDDLIARRDIYDARSTAPMSSL